MFGYCFASNKKKLLFNLKIKQNEKLEIEKMEMLVGGSQTQACISDAYNNHGWASTWLYVQSAFIPQTVAAIAGVCAINNL